MAISTSDVNALTDWTSAQFLLMAKHALAQVLVGNQSVSLGGRSYTRANIRELRSLIAELEELTLADSVGQKKALVSFGRQQS